LSKNGEAIGLFAPDGTQIDAITFGPQTNDVSMGRYPDGSPNIYSMPAPTPRAANSAPFSNTAPTLTPIGNKTVHQGQTLTFVASANDADQPAQTLAFSLDAGAPAAASINGSSGLFSWSTVGVAAPSSQNITVRVTDDGAPPLSAFEAITVTILPPPSFGTATLSGNQLGLVWGTASGRTYRIEYTDVLGSGNWQPLGNDIPGTGNNVTVNVTVTDSLHRFFRIAVVQ
jgi:hypothetical protein